LVCGPLEARPNQQVAGLQSSRGRIISAPPPDNRSGHVKLARRVDARHFGCFAAQQRAASRAAGPGNPATTWLPSGVKLALAM
jgi:hypothetical protein